jgi:hypothetical protein
MVLTKRGLPGASPLTPLHLWRGEEMKKAHPINQMSSKYAEYFEAINLTYLPPTFQPEMELAPCPGLTEQVVKASSGHTLSLS